jgi:ankyrin repeat protein
VQVDLADLLLGRGARIGPGVVRACLANGCPEAALHMARRGAPVGLEEAAGLGMADVVCRLLDAGAGAGPAKGLVAALMMACWYGRREVVALLLDRGVDVAARADGDGKTALHVAAYRGDPRLAELLVRRGAPVNVADGVYGTTPLVWAMHAWLVENRAPGEPYRAVLAMLADAGAEVRTEWLGDERLRADADVYAALARRAERRP